MGAASAAAYEYGKRCPMAIDRIVLAFAGLVLTSLLLSGCGDEESAPAKANALAPIETVAISPRTTPVERMLDGNIEAVNQGTVAAQTSGRVAEIPYDVN